MKRCLITSDSTLGHNTMLQATSIILPQLMLIPIQNFKVLKYLSSTPAGCWENSTTHSLGNMSWNKPIANLHIHFNCQNIFKGTRGILFVALNKRGSQFLSCLVMQNPYNKMFLASFFFFFVKMYNNLEVTLYMEDTEHCFFHLFLII